jgi:hypothetical protein
VERSEEKKLIELKIKEVYSESIEVGVEEVNRGAGGSA